MRLSKTAVSRLQMLRSPMFWRCASEQRERLGGVLVCGSRCRSGWLLACSLGCGLRQEQGRRVRLTRTSQEVGAPQLVVAFDARGRGTSDMVARARKAGVVVCVLDVAT